MRLAVRVCLGNVALHRVSAGQITVLVRNIGKSCVKDPGSKLRLADSEADISLSLLSLRDRFLIAHTGNKWRPFWKATR